MITSQKTFTLSKPSGDDPIPLNVLGFLRAHNKYNVYELVLNEFQRSGLTQAQLARRIRKNPDRVCKILGGPGNWTLDTIADLLFAISGGVAKYSMSYPLDEAARNISTDDVLSLKDHSEVRPGTGASEGPGINWPDEKQKAAAGA